jgi:hypothetical protein
MPVFISLVPLPLEKLGLALVRRLFVRPVDWFWLLFSLDFI